MKSFKEYVTLNEAKDDFLTPEEIKKLKAHYDGNSGLRNISQSIKDFVADHEAFVKLKGNVHKSIKDDMIKTSARLRKLGIEDGALNEDELGEAKEFKVIVSVRDARKANDLASDSYRGLYKNDGSDVFIFKKEDDMEDFKNDLEDLDLEVINESTLTFDRVTSPDSKGRKAITYKDSEGRESYPVEFSPKMIDEKKLVDAVRKILG